MKVISILGFSVDLSIDKLEYKQKQLIINTFNPHCYFETKYDAVYKNALQNSDMLIPDGVGIVWAAKVLHRKEIKKIAGADLHKFLLENLNQTGGKVFYLGSKPKTLKKIKSRLNQEYPNIRFGGYSPPFKQEFSNEDNLKMIKAINKFKPYVVFVGMTAPKQEKWSYKNKDLLDTKIIASIGAAFDFYAGTKKRAGEFWQRIGLEWVPRFFREPLRLWKRIFISNPTFVIDVLKEKYVKKHEK